LNDSPHPNQNEISKPESVSIKNGVKTCKQDQLQKHSNKNIEIADIDTCALSSDNLLHAGTTLKNTEHVYAVCVYGGAETKVKLLFLYLFL
jgi:magnesium-transporting ATPase (P-type)